MAEPRPVLCSTTTASRVSILILRVLTSILLLISLVVVSTTLETTDFDTIKVLFNDVYSYSLQVQRWTMSSKLCPELLPSILLTAYRYLISAIVIGCAYSLVQLVFSLFHALTGKRFIYGEGGALFDFYGDLVASYLQATGAAAGFGVTKDLKVAFEIAGIDLGDKFYDMAYASSSLLLAFVCTAILSVLSAYALPKKV